ncbi:hypothetical protein UT300003_02420 [Clostridium sardiniense]|uniref:tetratricopeptide repeat protein n=1 Tax=Clostridium sardiniense TaxID=29369 RepID=UPI00195E5786|nr:tetratricopeptide repeat protein [Clostridium sardiniense]MBM7833504.1 tetratricopeptide (TPR) repeat protein [Clostridium sardiniense]
MSNFDKKLDKATKYYENKKYKEALKLCDKILAKDYNNEKALELEGEILYKLDRIDEAILNWKINSEYNNNPTAKMRLEDIDKSTKEQALSFDNLNAVSSTPEDEIEDVVNPSTPTIHEINEEVTTNINTSEELSSENPAETVEDVEEVKIDTTHLDQEEITTMDEFNKEDSITSNEDIKEYVIDESENTSNYDVKSNNDSIDNKTESVDTNISNNIENKVHSSKLDDTNNSQSTSKTKTSSAKGKKSAIIAVCALIVVVAAYASVKHFNSNDSTPQTEQSQSQEPVQEVPANLKADLDKAIESKDINTLYTLLSETPADKVPADAKDSYDKALDMMKKDGVEKYYNDGLNAYKDKKFDVALDNLSKAYKYCGGTYLEPHVLYFLGSTENSLDKKDDAVKYFKEYLDKYPHSDLYTAEILYNLCLYYNDKGDKAEAKKYAQHLEDSYPSSPYYNDTSRKILYN